MWHPDDYSVPTPTDAGSAVDTAGMRRLADRTLPLVIRTDFDRPGFALVRFSEPVDPPAFRRALIDFVAGLVNAYRERHGRSLTLCSVGRFDQQASTEAHLDGAPEESILVLGYEPTPVRSLLSLYDYARAAADARLDPLSYLEQHKPTFGEGRALLQRYRTDLTGFDAGRHNVLVINNSSGPLAAGRTSGMLGVLHQSQIPVRGPQHHRYVNTLLLTPAVPSASGCGEGTIGAYLEAGAFAACC